MLGDAASWTGPNDGSFSFITGHDASRFVIAAHVTDERIEAGDAVEFFIDTRRDEKRRADPRMLRGTLRVKASAPDADGRAAVEAFVNRRPLEGCTAASRRVAGGYDLRIELPLQPFGRQAESPVPDFALAGVLHDVDESRGPKAEILWRGSPAIRARNAGYATFFWGE